MLKWSLPHRGLCSDTHSDDVQWVGGLITSSEKEVSLLQYISPYDLWSVVNFKRWFQYLPPHLPQINGTKLKKILLICQCQTGFSAGFRTRLCPQSPCGLVAPQHENQSPLCFGSPHQRPMYCVLMYMGVQTPGTFGTLYCKFWWQVTVSYECDMLWLQHPWGITLISRRFEHRLLRTAVLAGWAHVGICTYLIPCW